MHGNWVVILFFFFLSAAILTYGLALRSGKPYVRIVFLYLVLDLLTMVLSLSLTTIWRVDNNLFLFHIYTPLEYMVICLFFLETLSDRMVKKIVGWSIPFFIALSIVFSLFVQKVRENNSYINIIESILIICWTLLFFKEVLQLRQATVLYKYPLFWVSGGILVYFTETMVINGLLAYMVRHSMELARLTYRISFMFKYLLYLSLTVGACFEIAAKKSSDDVR
jgi:hypothetical protein